MRRAFDGCRSGSDKAWAAIPRCVVVAGIAITAFDATVADAFENVTGGIATDYQPSVIRSRDDGARIVVFERLDAAQSGDLWLTRSADDGASWSEPVAIVATDANERHPALLQLGPSNYVLFYLSGTGAASSFRIARATSSDGIAFDAHGAIDLGWTTGGEINPHVIRHADGRLTMSYQRLGSGAYVAESLDGGVTWDTRRTSIAAGAALPRIAFRDSDGLYLASYQVNPGDNALHVFVKTTHDVTDWSAAAADFAVEGNHHDSLPVVMPDDAFAVFWIRASGNAFDIAVRRSRDGFVWSAPLAVTASPGADDVEPHPLVGASATDVELYWGRAAVAGTLDYDIVREAHVVVDDGVFVDGFDPEG